MPEGHTLHRVAGALTTAFAGSTPRVSSPQGRFADGAALVDGQVMTRAWAHGKLLFLDFEGGRTIHIHLGLIGTLAVTPLAPDHAPGPAPDAAEPAHAAPPVAAPPVTGAVRLRLLGERHVADLRGPSTCVLLGPEEVAALIARQGPDPLQPLSEVNDPERAFARLQRSGRSVAEMLMDQSVVAGVGNIYRCEVLWRHRVSPAAAGRRIRRSTWNAMREDLVELMPLGVATGRIITLDEVAEPVREALAAGGEVTEVPREFAVYKRTGEACLRCGSAVRTKVLAGRNLFWCGGCQRRV